MAVYAEHQRYLLRHGAGEGLTETPAASHREARFRRTRPAGTRSIFSVTSPPMHFIDRSPVARSENTGLEPIVAVDFRCPLWYIHFRIRSDPEAFSGSGNRQEAARCLERLGARCAEPGGSEKMPPEKGRADARFFFFRLLMHATGINGSRSMHR